MISRVQWLKEYDKRNMCIKMEEYCTKNCDKCEFNFKYSTGDLAYFAAEIFNTQLMTDKGLYDDGK